MPHTMDSNTGTPGDEETQDLVACADCGEVCGQDDLYSVGTVNGIRYGMPAVVCGVCIDEYVEAADTGELIARDDAYVHVYSDGVDYYQYESNLPQETELLDYSANVFDTCGYGYIQDNGRHSPTIGDAIALGVELETDSRNEWGSDEIAEQLHEQVPEFFGNAICKSDSTCTGPEIVTLPATLTAHTEHMHWPRLLAAARPIAKGFHGRDNGIHIHLNRACMSERGLAKLLVFMNHPTNREFIEAIAQRQINSWCSVDHERFDTVTKGVENPRNGKYSAVNVTRQTAEFRIFNSTLIPARLFKNLEFVHALATFCNEAAPNNTYYGDGPERFCEYLRKYRWTYPHLVEFIMARLSDNADIPDLAHPRNPEQGDLALCV